MQISELAARAGTSVATVKYYLREGMLHRGEVTSPTRAQYSEAHLDRLRLIMALGRVNGLPLAKVKEILKLMDHPDAGVTDTVGAAVDALPPYVAEDPEYARGAAMARAVGLHVDETCRPIAQLDAALAALEIAGLPTEPEIIRKYADATMAIASSEIAPMAGRSPEEVMRAAVLGTALYEPVILALRRLAHQHLLSERDDDHDDDDVQQ